MAGDFEKLLNKEMVKAFTLDELDVLGIAGAARSMTPDAMRAELEPLGRLFATLGAPLLHYKTCSTFDSAPQLGSIGHAVSVLQPFAANPLVAIVGGQPNLGRYCLFGNLFAALRTGGEVYRLDRHPTMRAHPATPMHEADLRLLLDHERSGAARAVIVDAIEGASGAVSADADAVAAGRRRAEEDRERR